MAATAGTAPSRPPAGWASWGTSPVPPVVEIGADCPPDRTRFRREVEPGRARLGSRPAGRGRWHRASLTAQRPDVEERGAASGWLARVARACGAPGSDEG